MEFCWACRVSLLTVICPLQASQGYADIHVENLHFVLVLLTFYNAFVVLSRSVVCTAASTDTSSQSHSPPGDGKRGGGGDGGR